jgi:hypothetical protein
MKSIDALRHRRSTRTLTEVDALLASADKWRNKRHDLDVDPSGRPAGHHKSQIDTIATTISSIANSLKQRCTKANALDDDDAFFDMLALYDDSVIWLGRLFQFFTTKFAQRENGPGMVLGAADQVVWSCYEPVMRAAGRRDVMPPPPLPFIARELSPAAIVHDTPLPPPLRAPTELGGKPVAVLEKIPVPLLQLPPHVERAPWTLVFAGHEAAHYLINDLRLRDHVANGIAAKGSDEIADENTWRAWSEEIAADFIALLLFGSASRDALVDELWASAAAMDAPPQHHPPARLRLSVLDTAAAKLGIAGAENFADDHHFALVEFLLAPIPGLGKLETLCGFAPRSLATNIAWWEGQMTSDDAVDQRGYDAPRYAAAAAYRAWTALARANGDASKLAERASALIAGCGPEGEREAVAAPELEPADALTDLLVNDVKERRRQRLKEGADAL